MGKRCPASELGAGSVCACVSVRGRYIPAKRFGPPACCAPLCNVAGRVYKESESVLG
jgi:hypothetical protein